MTETSAIRQSYISKKAAELRAVIEADAPAGLLRDEALRMLSSTTRLTYLAFQSAGEHDVVEISTLAGIVSVDCDVPNCTEHKTTYQKDTTDA